MHIIYMNAITLLLHLCIVNIIAAVSGIAVIIVVVNNITVAAVIILL